MRQEANWSRSNFCLVTFRFRQPKDILAANSCAGKAARIVAMGKLAARDITLLALEISSACKTCSCLRRRHLLPPWARISVFVFNVKAGVTSGRSAALRGEKRKHASIFNKFQGYLRRSEAV